VGHGKYQLEIWPTHSGKYKLYLYCSELVVPSAYPLLAFAEPMSSQSPQATLSRKSSAVDRKAAINKFPHTSATTSPPSTTIHLNKVVLHGEGLSMAQLNEPAEFIVDCSELPHGAMGRCTATLIGDRADIPVRLTSMRNQVHFLFLCSQKGLLEFLSSFWGRKHFNFSHHKLAKKELFVTI
jgi:hypothetical protein